MDHLLPLLLAQLAIGAQAIGVVTRVSPAVQNRDVTEAYLTQPAVMLEINPWRDFLSLKTTLNLEGATVERGELTPGIYGEGYIDRRHPHTYLHELMLVSMKRFGAHQSSAVSLAIGKGFAAFGTDDPMARPFEKYPINHHLSQILERAVAIGAVHVNNWILEASSFNGDEPTGPGDTPNRDRYWDSWSGRLTFTPWSQAEFQTSYARVTSPENPAGGGADQRKQSASIRLEDAQHSGYALFEWARTGDYVGATRTFTFTSLLAETWAKYDRVNGALRIERTERPDEQRLADEFRTPVPATDLSISGRSRWTIISARAGVSLAPSRTVGIDPFVEVARARVSPTMTPSGFDPRSFYGSSTLWSLSTGVKISFGMAHMRMGRYGAASASTSHGMRGMSMPGMPEMK
ncbi:MAG TPA: hypothetical protein VJ840_13955 [Gemmatimonadaceae bacterium]|nr:hypothetical protein [Gemmatimonadaceae bacterium]